MGGMVGVELFKPGTYTVIDHRTKQVVKRKFTPKDIEQLVDNFHRFQEPALGEKRRHKLNVVKGHDPHPAAPKYGTPDRVYRDADGKLKWDASKIDDELHGDIKKGRFDDISAEIYDDPSDAGLPGGTGLMLRRISILGADVPKVKDLNPEGLAKTLTFAEEDKPAFTILCNTFSEGAMGRDEMMKTLLEKGATQEILDTMDDVQLQDMVKMVGSATTKPAAETETPAETPADDETEETSDDETESEDEDNDEDTETPAPSEMPASTDEPGKTPNTDDNKDKKMGDSYDVGDDENASAQKYSEMCDTAKKHKEAHKAKFGKDLGEKATAMSFSESDLKIVVGELLAPVKAAADAELAASRAETAKLATERKRERVQIFCENERRIGRVSCAEMDTSAPGPNLVERMVLLDDTEKVHKFSEGGETKEITALDAEMRAIRQRPIKFASERAKVGEAGAVQTFSETAPEALEKNFLQFAEEHAPDLEKIGTTPADYLKSWKTARKNGQTKHATELEEAIGFKV